MSRVGAARLLQLAEDLGPQERSLIETLAKLKLATHRQLATLLRSPSPQAAPDSDARNARRILARLTDLGIFKRLERQIGGVRAGSAGYVYFLGSAGQRLLAYWQGRGLVQGRHKPEPGSRFVRHTLAISDLYVQVVRTARSGIELEVLDFELEPSCWRPFSDGLGGTTMLKPDAFVRVGIGGYTISSFVEVDLGSESRSVIARKARTYIDYFNSGIEQAEQGVFPRVVFLATSEPRKAAIVSVLANLGPEFRELFRISTLDRGVAALSLDKLGGLRG